MHTCGSGFDDEYIEISSELETLRQRVAELEKERDKLLDAIKRAKYWMAGSEAKRILDEAIASVKEK